MKTALVTGANGFIGSHLVSELALKGFKVYTICRNDRKAKNPEYNKLVEEGKVIPFFAFLSFLQIV